MIATPLGTRALTPAAADEQDTSSPSGLVVVEQGGGFRATFTASRDALSAVRDLTHGVAATTGRDLADDAVLVVSELMGNSVKATPGQQPELMVEVYPTSTGGVQVSVHDTAPGQPSRRDVALDSPEATSGRGLHLIDALTTCSTVTKAEPPYSKKFTCQIG